MGYLATLATLARPALPGPPLALPGPSPWVPIPPLLVLYLRYLVGGQCEVLSRGPHPALPPGLPQYQARTRVNVSFDRGPKD